MISHRVAFVLSVIASGCLATAACDVGGAASIDKLHPDDGGSDATLTDGTTGSETGASVEAGSDASEPLDANEVDTGADAADSGVDAPQADATDDASDGDAGD